MLNIFILRAITIYLLEKIIKIWGYRANILSGGPNQPPPQHISYILLYNKLKVDNFGRFNDFPFL